MFNLQRYKVHKAEDLVKIFNKCFFKDYNTILEFGDDEPIYLPASKKNPYNVIYFANGYFSSALHECAHWLIALEKRRTLVDYGYWYVPDGRNAIEQKNFLKVEVKPQAVELLLSNAARYKFQFSLDNLNGEATDVAKFKKDVQSQALHYKQFGLGKRGDLFLAEILRYYESLKVPEPAFCDSF
jgi:elongation factor P hydroxylase